MVAIAAEMLTVIYHMLKDGTAYQEYNDTHRDERRKQMQIKYHQEQLKKLLGENPPEKESA